MAVRLLARFYPRLKITGGGATRTRYLKLAHSINPNIEIVRGRSDFGVAIGSEVSPSCPDPIFAGSSSWDAHVSADSPVSVGASQNPFGAGAAACLAVGELFRLVFDIGEPLNGLKTLSALDLDSRPSLQNETIEGVDVGSAVLVGVGAIGNAAVWALSRAPVRGELHLVDHQRIELSNVQRYVLSTRKDDDVVKVELAAKWMTDELLAVPHEEEWGRFVATHGHRLDQVLVALDTAQARRDVQASLPRWIANAWTQAGDLGVSTHPWTEDGACLACMYLPSGPLPGEDRIIGSALGLTTDAELLQIRRLLHTNSPLPSELHAQVSAHLGIEPDALNHFADKPLRSLYVEGLCGGAVLPLSRIGHPTQDVHVPIAHQSALAGVLLAGRLVAKAMGLAGDGTRVTRIDVLRPLGEYVTQPMQKDDRDICICQDSVYRSAFRAKYVD